MIELFSLNNFNFLIKLYFRRYVIRSSDPLSHYLIGPQIDDDDFSFKLIFLYFCFQRCRGSETVFLWRFPNSIVSTLSTKLFWRRCRRCTRCRRCRCCCSRSTQPRTGRRVSSARSRSRTVATGDVWNKKVRLKMSNFTTQVKKHQSKKQPKLNIYRMYKSGLQKNWN